MDFSLASIREALNAFFTRYYYLCVLSICVFVALLGWLFLLKGEYANIQESGLVDLQTATAALEKRQAYVHDLEQMSAAYDELNREQLRQLSAVLPEDVDEISLMNVMYGFAAEAHVSILSIDVVLTGNAAKIAASQTAQTNLDAAAASAPLVSNKEVNIANVTMNVSPENNSYANFKAFLETLDRFVPVLNLRQMTYSPDTTSYALQLETYYAESSTQ